MGSTTQEGTLRVTSVYREEVKQSRAVIRAT